MNNVYFDEAGNTGFDLLNKDQPVFVLAANIFDEETAQTLISEFNTQNGAEVKFKNLKKSDSGRAKIIKFIEQVVKTPKMVKCLVIHKKFMLLAKILDILVEPVYYHRGVNFNANARNISTANMYWYVILGFYGENALDLILSKFVELIKNKSRDNRINFYGTILKVKGNPINPLNTLSFEDILASRKFAEQSLKIITKEYLDPVQCGLFTQATLWGKQFNGEFTAIHDDSNSLEASISYFNQFTNPDEVRTQIGNDFRAFELPLKVNSVHFKDSKKFPQIQISDLIAGAMAHFTKAYFTNSEDELSKALKQSGIEKLITHIIYPTPQVTPEEHGIMNPVSYEGSTNPVDQVAEFLLNQFKRNLI